MSAAFSSAYNYISGLLTSFRALGSHLIDGLMGGITEKLAALKAGIFGIGDKIVGWFKGRLGIKSPSRVFAGLGGHIASGLALGIDRGAQGPIRRTRALAAELAEAMAIGAATPSLAHTAAAGAGGARGAAAAVHHHYHRETIQITVAGGGDPKAQAREIWREIRELQAKEARGSYRDTH